MQPRETVRFVARLAVTIATEALPYADARLLIPFGGTNATLALRHATSDIPIVTNIAADPVKLGLAESFNRPGRNITGVYMITTAIISKRLQLLHDLVPNASRVGLLVNPANPDAQNQIDDANTAARKLGQDVLVIKASDESEIERAFAELSREHVDSILLGNDVFFNTRSDLIVRLAASDHLPAIYPYRLFTDVGGLASYATDLASAYRQCGEYAAKILNGEKAAELPILEADKFEFVVNLKTAKSLGITVPLVIQMTADEVIQ
jgi:putative tryptophan/tyrosine transport system substrate-binding protein